MRVTAFNRYSLLDLPRAYADLPVELVLSAPGEELADNARRSEVLILSAGSYDAALAQRLAEPDSQLKLIQFLSAGYDQAQRFGVPAGLRIANASNVWAPVVAEHAVAMLMGLLRQLPALERLRAEGRWGLAEVTRCWVRRTARRSAFWATERSAARSPCA